MWSFFLWIASMSPDEVQALFANSAIPPLPRSSMVGNYRPPLRKARRCPLSTKRRTCPCEYRERAFPVPFHTERISVESVNSFRYWKTGSWMEVHDVFLDGDVVIAYHTYIRDIGCSVFFVNTDALNVKVVPCHKSGFLEDVIVSLPQFVGFYLNEQGKVGSVTAPFPTKWDPSLL